MMITSSCRATDSESEVVAIMPRDADDGLRRPEPAERGATPSRTPARCTQREPAMGGVPVPERRATNRGRLQERLNHRPNWSANTPAVQRYTVLVAEAETCLAHT